MLKGQPGRIVVSEPGGDGGRVRHVINGVPQLKAGEEVIVFLYRTPIGYVRIFGLSQGKLSAKSTDSQFRERIRRVAAPRSRR